MAETREQTHDPKADNGVEVTPCCQIAPKAGWLAREMDPRENGYTGDNAPWRK
jgi:hypothetical protein